MRSRFNILRFATAALLGSALHGCGKPASVQPVAVRGQVLLQGRPLVNGSIVFAPNREKGNIGKTVAAPLDLEGRYHFPADGPKSLTPGWYRIALAEPPDLNLTASGYPPFPIALRRPDLAGLDRELVAGGENTLDFLIEVGE